MKINKIIFLMIFFLAVSSLVFTQGDSFSKSQAAASGEGPYEIKYNQNDSQLSNSYKDPFENLLPREAGPEGLDKIGSQKDKLGPPPLNIEGVMWGSSEPKTIINGEVYAVGDIVPCKGAEAKIFRIKENTVFISYGEKIFEMNTKTKGVK
ncbi:MAG: hypothetical protein JW867_06820 [Candidatus Omnitrophica bacterium]|nr:hypothetical protein [Candidatus Omnitrophota bacterium]